MKAVRRRATPQHRAIQRLMHTSRLYEVLSHVGEAVIRATRRDELLYEVCRIAVELGGLPLAWIGFVDEETGAVMPAAVVGPAAEYVAQIRLSVNDEPEGRGPTGTAIRECRPVVKNDLLTSPDTMLWHAMARRHNLRASVAFPLVVHGRSVGALNLYASRPGFFNVNELSLLKRVAGSLAFALEKLIDEDQRRRDEQVRLLDIERQEALLRLGEMGASSEREIVEYALEEAVRLTRSTIGYLHFVNDDQVHLQLFTWSRGVREACYAEEATHYPIAAAGVWVDCLRERRPVYHNDYQHLEGRKGYPEGHIHLERHLSVPLIDGEHAVAIAGVGNKAEDYDETDARQLLLFMGGMWALLQRKRVEAALRESETRYRRLTEHAPDLIYRYRLAPSPGFEYVSPAATALTGYTPEDHYADPELGFKLIHPDDRHALAAMSQGSQGLLSPLELRWVRRDGRLLWVEQRNVPIVDEQGALVAVEGIARDITDRKGAEEALKAERARLEARVAERTHELQQERDRTGAILESLGEAVMVFSIDGDLEYMNPAAIALVGNGPGAEAAVQRWWDEQRSSPDGALAMMQAAARAGQPWQGELVFTRSDGPPYEAAVTVAPLFDHDHPGQPIGFVSVHRDITAMKVAERMKDQFVSNVSHELRSPTSLITMLAGNLEMLYGRLDDARRLEVIGEIRKHARALSDLIGDVLEISRIDGGRLATDRRALDLARLVHEEVSHLAPIAGRKALQLIVEVDDALPVLGQAGQLQQVLRNLLTNAIKYTPDGGRVSCTGRVIMGGEPVPGHDLAWPGITRLAPGQWATVKVADSGIGISQSDLPHIFERFYRAQTQGEIPGTGLGLSIAAELIKRHGGSVEVRSTVGEGSTFVVYLPLAAEGL